MVFDMFWSRKKEETFKKKPELVTEKGFERLKVQEKEKKTQSYTQ